MHFHVYLGSRSQIGTIMNWQNANMVYHSCNKIMIKKEKIDSITHRKVIWHAHSILFLSIHMDIKLLKKVWKIKFCIINI